MPIRKTECEQLNKLMSNFKLLAKEEKNKPKAHTRNKIIKIRAEINAMEIKRMLQKIKEAKSWFFKRINKIDKPFSQTSKKERKRSKIHAISNEKGETTMETAEIQRIINTYFENLYDNNMENTEEIDRS